MLTGYLQTKKGKQTKIIRIPTLQYKLKQAKNMAENKHETKFIVYEPLMCNTGKVNCMQQPRLGVRLLHEVSIPKPATTADAGKSPRM